jgi:hypothetical protein
MTATMEDCNFYAGGVPQKKTLWLCWKDEENVVTDHGVWGL